MKHNYMQLMERIESVQVGDELTFDDVDDFLGRIKAVGKAGAELARRNLIIDENFIVQQTGASPAPFPAAPNNQN